MKINYVIYFAAVPFTALFAEEISSNDLYETALDSEEVALNLESNLSEIAYADPQDTIMMSSSKVFMSSQLRDSKRLFALGEVLLWRAQQSGLGFAIEKQTSSTTTKAKVKSPEYDWDWGFRLGFGYTLPHDDWD
ncbi:MAG: hypothetical protein FJZ57_04225, partial [Chlamydiae bacterium]|nr:hypothetical protein [Chlamydiota bacterium]